MVMKSQEVNTPPPSSHLGPPVTKCCIVAFSERNQRCHDWERVWSTGKSYGEYQTFAKHLQTSSDSSPLLTFAVFQGWVFNVVPWLVAIPTSLFSGFLSDHLINQGYKTITVRKFMQVIGSGVSSMFALCLGQTSSFCNAIVFASASVGLQTFNHSGISVNVQDLAPSCAGLLFGVGNTGGALLGVVCVYLAGYLMETTGSWISVFNLVAAVNSVGLCAFLVFGEAQRVDTDSAYIDM
ncbi:solute carrier family 17 member 9 [Meleagris gallopavo]|uniref:solute carrier family 17 member 9 n=1 Tax=Meleagris gallopavo TaxID=9103 RepID=UPI00093F5EA6|nr:solute carrier family 17 member 9 [Meleagris gallopavo]